MKITIPSHIKNPPTDEQVIRNGKDNNLIHIWCKVPTKYYF